MSLKPDISKWSPEEMQQLAAGRYQLMQDNNYIDEAILGDIRALASEIMVDVYNIDTSQDAFILTGEQSLYRQNLIEALVSLLKKQGKQIARRNTT